MKASCTKRAASTSKQAATQPVGRRIPTSSAWEGPERTATLQIFPVSSWITWLRRRFVSRSIPLETDTTTVFSVRYGAIFFAVSRTAKEGGALTTRSAPFKQSKSPVMWRDSGRWTPCKSGFSRVRAISAALAGLWDQR